MAYSPSPPFSAPHLSSLLRSSSSAALLEEQDKYFSVLLAERHKLSPFMHVLPHTYRLLNQDVGFVADFISTKLVEFSG
uniref:STAR protein homodimerisation region domain-containing protein n=1 Tax=Rhizophora mucronata TaxID=61149 RepID=A0A2P2LYA4_RHIMU